jgi:hypothetical protein
VKIAIATLIAYLLAGMNYVWGDMRQPFWNQPAYVRSKNLFSLLSHVLTWPVIASMLIFGAWRGSQRRNAILSFALFGVALFVGLGLL